MSRACLLLLSLLATSCVTGRYSQVSVFEPVASEQLAALQPGRDDLQSCLDRLGAPIRVFEYRVQPDRTSGIGMLWFWNNTRNWGLRASLSIRSGVSVSFDYGRDNRDLPGCVLWFDENLVLERWREGLVGDLLRGLTRPAPVID